MGAKIEFKPYWIKVQKTKSINKIKTRVYLAEEDFFDAVILNDSKFGVEVVKVKVCQVPCLLFKHKKCLYLLEEHLANRDWGGIDEDIC